MEVLLGVWGGILDMYQSYREWVWAPPGEAIFAVCGGAL